MKNKTRGIEIVIIIIVLLIVISVALLSNNKNDKIKKVVSSDSTTENVKKEEKKDKISGITIASSNTLKNGTYEVDENYTLKIKDNKLSINDKVVSKNASSVSSKLSRVKDNLALSFYNKKTKLYTLYIYNEKGEKLYSISKINKLNIDNSVDAINYYNDYALIRVSKINTKDFKCKSKYKKNIEEVYKLIYPTDNKYDNLKTELVSKDTIKITDICK